jgi:hypothetical protein
MVTLSGVGRKNSGFCRGLSARGWMVWSGRCVIWVVYARRVEALRDLSGNFGLG